MNEHKSDLRREALSISEVCALVGIGRTKVYESIANGNLKACKLGKRTLVTPSALQEFLASLPPAT